MTVALPGVRVGPLDPDATEAFGQVAQGSTARQLIRLHRQLFPPQLLRALARPLDVSHTKAVRENLDAVREHLGGLTRDNDDPLVPEGAEVIDAAVRGDRATGQVLTFQYQLPSGRVGKWHAAYREEDLPDVYAAGSEYAKIKEMRDRGVVAYDSEATHLETLRRQLQQSREENARLREQGGGEGGGPTPAAEDQRAIAGHLEEVERLRRENDELRTRVAQVDALQAAGGGGMPTAGVDEHFAGQGAGAEQTVATQDPPFEGYESLKADDLVTRIKAEDTSDDERRAILEYERTHANRKSVVGAAEQALDRE